MGVAIAWLNNRYDELIGRAEGERRHPWLRSMRAEAEGHVSARVGTTATERVPRCERVPASGAGRRRAAQAARYSAFSQAIVCSSPVA
jgi:hypothetical protein